MILKMSVFNFQQSYSAGVHHMCNTSASIHNCQRSKSKLGRGQSHNTLLSTAACTHSRTHQDLVGIIMLHQF